MLMHAEGWGSRPNGLGEHPTPVAGMAGESGKDTECLVKQVEVTDEYGTIWLIYKGDSAWDQCRFLAASGVAEVVLPRETLLQGTLPSPHSVDTFDVPVESVRMSEDVEMIVQRQIRLKDCVTWLTNERRREWTARLEEAAYPPDSLTM